MSVAAGLLLSACLTGCASLDAGAASDTHTYSSDGSAATPGAGRAAGTAPGTRTTGAAGAAGTTAEDPGRDPGCVAALKAIGKYGPSSVKLLADGRKAVNQVGVQLLVTALGGAADAADQPKVRQDIQTLADVYDNYFDLTTDAVSVPLSTLLKDTVDLEGLCHE